MKFRCHLITAAALLAATCPLRADEVTENIANAKAAYESGAYSEAIQALDYASQLIRQKKGEEVVKVLPAAPSGWAAEEAENESQSSALLGGMVTAKRTYRRESGGRVTIQIQSDSAMLQTFGMMFSNPMMMTASGAKMETIKGQKCAVTFKTGAKEGNIKAIVDNRYLVDVEGDEVTRDELVTFAKAIDYSKLAALK